MQLPDDFGLSPIATLAHVGRRAPSWRHAAFWGTWEKSFSPEAPAIRAISPGSADKTDPTATHVFESFRSVSIGAVLVEPPKGVKLRAGVVAVHGYSGVGPLAGERERWEHLASRGVACLCIRLRGFAGSAREVGLLTAHDDGWICHGLAELMSGEDASPSVQVATWIVPQAVADVVNAGRALSRWMGGGLPVHLSGESLGAGLCVIAAARSRLVRFERMALGLPSMGDWLWRLGEHADPARRGSPERSPESAGYQVAQLLTRFQAQRERFLDTVRLCDAVVHAPDVTASVLCKLAERDEVVPAPTAAAVYNALGTPPHLRWRFVVPFGHFDGGLRNARRHALFDRAADLFLDPLRRPDEAAHLVEDILLRGERLSPEAESALACGGSRRASAPAEEPPSLFGFSGDQPASEGGPLTAAASARPEVSIERLLCEQYKLAGRTLDDLPYTEEFDRVSSAVRSSFPSMTDRDVFHKLHNIRKAGRLPKLGRSQGTKPAVPQDDERLLIELVEDAVGSAGQRDQLPYTDAFDRLVWAFNQRTGRSLHAHEVWRLVATLSK